MIKILKYGEVSRDEIFARTAPTVNVEATVAEIIKNVRELGNKALFEYCEKFDKARLDSLIVTESDSVRCSVRERDRRGHVAR